MDDETKKILEEQARVKEIVEHQGWKHVRQIFFDKLLKLQNAFDIDTTRTATTVQKELAIRKKAHEILTEFWQEVEGTAAASLDNKSLIKDKSYIYNREED